MSITYTYHPDQNYFLTKVIGVVQRDEVLAHFDKLIADEGITLPCFEIVDFSDATSFDFGYYDSDNVMEKMSTFGNTRPFVGTIFIANNDYFLGIGNMFKVIGEQSGNKIDIATSLDIAIEMVAEHFSSEIPDKNITSPVKT